MTAPAPWPMAWSIEHGMVVRRAGSGPEVVWIHGLGEQSASFDAIAQALPGFTHVLPDLPGYGRSAWPDVAALPAGDSLAQLADHLVAWLGTRRPIVVGHSLGGVLATLIAERMPVAAVVNVEGNLSRGDCTFSAAAVAYTLEDFVARGFAEMRAAVYLRGVTEPSLRGYFSALALACPQVLHRHATDLVAASSTETLAARLAAVPAPVLFVAGVPGGVCARSRALLDLHAVRWIGIEPAGHWPFVDQPELFAARVRDFLTHVR